MPLLTAAYLLATALTQRAAALPGGAVTGTLGWLQLVDALRKVMDRLALCLDCVNCL